MSQRLKSRHYLESLGEEVVVAWLFHNIFQSCIIETFCVTI